MSRLSTLLLSIVTLATVAACVSVSQRTATNNELVIDFHARRATTASWSEAFVDCSTDKVSCIGVANRFLMASPKVCPDAADNWSAAGYNFRMTAPMPHLSAPSGGYISNKYPRIHMVYWSGKGFVSLSRTRHTPYEANWSPSDVLEDYRVRYVGQGGRFACDTSMPAKTAATPQAD
jgi:hypothetical protein